MPRDGSVLHNDPACQQVRITEDNDGPSTNAFALGFPVEFYDTVYRHVTVGADGYVGFEAVDVPHKYEGRVVPWGQDPPSEKKPPMIAPFYAGHVDTHNYSSSPSSGAVHFGWTTYEGHTAFCVEWFTRNADGTVVGVGGTGQGNKRNVFQMLLVDRSDSQDPSTEGDFDIIFNYDSIQWETVTDGFCPQAGFTAGTDFPQVNTQIAGSGKCGAFLDSNATTGLANNTNEGLSQPDGRWVFHLFKDRPPPSGGDLSGHVRDQAGTGLVGASVMACRYEDAARQAVTHPCRATVTGSDAHYSLPLLPDGTYWIQAYPPSGSPLGAGTRAPVTIADGTDLDGQDVALTPLAPLPGGTSITPRSRGGGQTPTIFMGSTTHLRTTSRCPGGTGKWTLALGLDDATGLPYSRSGPMTEQTTNPGTYVGTIPPTSLRRGAAKITITITCPNGSDQTFAFNLYIDPSGVVMDTKGNLLPGATVILYRSESGANQFTQVPDQSVIMSPGNRTNPDLTDAVGHFGWDVLEGDYKVRAQAPGCTDPNNPSKNFVETGVLPIPPPVFDLELVLQCPSSPSSPSEVLLTYDDPVPTDPSDPCRSGSTFKRTAPGDHDDITVCTYDEDGDPLATDTSQAHLEWSIDGAGSAAPTLGFNPTPPLETSGAGAVAPVGIDALSPGDNFVEVDLVSASGTVLDSFELENQVRAPTTTRDVVTDLTARKKNRFIRGRAKATDAECRAGRAVTLFRRRPGSDPVIGTATTTQSGRWRVRTGRRRGTYYARIAMVTATDTVTGDTLNCLGDQSRSVRRR